MISRAKWYQILYTTLRRNYGIHSSMVSSEIKYHIYQKLGKRYVSKNYVRHIAHLVIGEK